MKQLKGYLNNFSKEISVEHNLFRSEIQKINNEIEDLDNRKQDKKENEIFKSKVLADLEQKVIRPLR